MCTSNEYTFIHMHSNSAILYKYACKDMHTRTATSGQWQYGYNGELSVIFIIPDMSQQCTMSPL